MHKSTSSKCHAVQNRIWTFEKLNEYRIRVIRTPSWLEPQETYFERTLVIFGKKSSKVTVFSDENLPKLAIVHRLKVKKNNRTSGLWFWLVLVDWTPSYEWRKVGVPIKGFSLTSWGGRLVTPPTRSYRLTSSLGYGRDPTASSILTPQQL